MTICLYYSLKRYGSLRSEHRNESKSIYQIIILEMWVDIATIKKNLEMQAITKDYSFMLLLLHGFIV